MNDEAVDSYLKGGFIEDAISILLKDKAIMEVVDLYESIDMYEPIILLIQNEMIK